MAMLRSMSYGEAGFVYKGETKQGIRHGNGTYNYPGGIFQYTGPWVDGVKAGSRGKFSLAGFFEHEGDFVNGQMTGKGSRTWVDGRQFDGDWVDGEMTGRGVWSNSNTNESYDGEFLCNKRHGHGTLRMKSGDIYDGEFKTHKFNGRGAYLKEGKFVIDGQFKDGIVDGFARITWHRIGGYEGFWREGVISSPSGFFATVDGSYLYAGGFTNGAPVTIARSMIMQIDRTVIPQPPVDSSKPPEKGKKEAPKDKKGAKDGAEIGSNVVSVTAGTQIGTLHIILTPETPESLESKRAELNIPLISTDTPLAAPVQGCSSLGMPLLLNEVRRRLAVSLVPYIPPAVIEEAPVAKGKPAKGAVSSAAAPSGPPATAAAVGLSENKLPPVPLWLKQGSLAGAAAAWRRFPANAIKYLCGKCSRPNESGMKLSTGADASFTASTEGILSTRLTHSDALVISLSSSTVLPSVSLVGQDLMSVTFIIELDIDGISRLNTTTDPRWIEIPLLTAEVWESDGAAMLVESSLSFKVLVPPVSASADLTSSDQPSASAADTAAPIEWSAGVWEYKQSCSGGGEQFSTVSWAGGLPAHDSWHSLALNVKCRRNDKELSSDAPGDGEAASIDLVVDGSNRIRKDEGRPGTSSGNKTGNIGALARSWFEAFGSSLGTSADNTTFDGAAPERNLKVFIGNENVSEETVASGAFLGSIGSVVICNRDDVCDSVESTSCFAEWARRAVHQLEEREQKSSAEGEPTSTIPEDCTEHTSVSLVCRGGYGLLEGLVVPLGTAEGTYVLEVRDDVTSSCLVSSNRSSGTFCAPDGVEGMCAMVEPIPSFKSLRIIVAPPAVL